MKNELHGADDATTGPKMCNEYAIKQLNNGKAPGPDNIHGEMLKLFDDDGVRLLTKLFNKVYSSVPTIDSSHTSLLYQRNQMLQNVRITGRSA